MGTNLPRDVLRVKVRVPRRPTENPEKVKLAVRNLFPDAVFTREDEVLEADASSVETLREHVRGQKIRDAARGALFAGLKDGRLSFRLNKQAAFAGKVSFGANSPLRDIEVEIEADDPEAVIDLVAESTTRPPPAPLE